MISLILSYLPKPEGKDGKGTRKKHTTDLKKLKPNKEEMEEAVRFVLHMDGHETRRQDLGTILKQIGFDADEILQQIDKPR